MGERGAEQEWEKVPELQRDPGMCYTKTVGETGFYPRLGPGRWRNPAPRASLPWPCAAAPAGRLCSVQWTPRHRSGVPGCQLQPEPEKAVWGKKSPIWRRLLETIWGCSSNSVESKGGKSGLGNGGSKRKSNHVALNHRFFKAKSSHFPPWSLPTSPGFGLAGSRWAMLVTWSWNAPGNCAVHPNAGPGLNFQLLCISPLCILSRPCWRTPVAGVPESLRRQVLRCVRGPFGDKRAPFWGHFRNLRAHPWAGLGRPWRDGHRRPGLLFHAGEGNINRCCGADFPDYKPKAAFHRGLFTVKLIKSKLPGSSVIMVSSQAQYPCLLSVTLRFFFKRKHSKLHKLQALQTFMCRRSR